MLRAVGVHGVGLHLTPMGLANPVSIGLVDDVARDTAKLRELVQQADVLRKSIRARVRAELRSGTPQVELVRRTGWTRETIRKIAASQK